MKSIDNFEFIRLIVKSIYEKLENDCSVSGETFGIFENSSVLHSYVDWRKTGHFIVICDGIVTIWK